MEKFAISALPKRWVKLLHELSRAALNSITIGTYLLKVKIIGILHSPGNAHCNLVLGRGEGLTPHHSHSLAFMVYPTLIDGSLQIKRASVCQLNNLIIC